MLIILSPIIVGNTYAELQTNEIKIIYPSNNLQIQVGNLTIKGISSYNFSRQCTVYANWNDTQPFQRAIPTGHEGNDYST